SRTSFNLRIAMSVVLVQMDGCEWRETDSETIPAEVQSLMTKLASLERYSEHPTALAILSWAESQGLSFRSMTATGFENEPGFGIGGIVEGESLLSGSSSWLQKNQIKLQVSLEQQAVALDQQGISSIRIAVDGKEVALIGIEDRIREEAPALIRDLKAEGMEVTLLSGDRRQAAEAIARRLGGMEVIAEVLPEEKDQVIQSLQAGGRKVAMVGDGVNDAPALVRADVGIAMGSGTDVSIASADIVLMSSELEKVRLAASLSRRTLKTIRQNIGISIAYNLIMVPLAMAAIVTPLVAAISMPLSSLAVIGNSARIRTLFRGIKAR
ncbi:heavy metal translocating P-type ATPase, partial [endosymbiont of Lamellibrachia barhami]|uniref:heavy metal translocating P-type ATPase n=1 Tax=endosymbiont of Lamellibrachia barhami TaxID=205975 RepID=UPI0015AF1159